MPRYFYRTFVLTWLSLARLFVPAGLAQQRDSLWRIAHDAALPDSVTLKALNDIAFNLHVSDPDSGIRVASRVIRLAHQKGLTRREAYGFNSRGLNYKSKGNFKLSLTNFSEALRLFQSINDEKGIALSYGNMAVAFENLANYPLALEYSFKSWKLLEKLDNRKAMAILMGNIGNLYLGLHQLHKALDFHRKGLQMNQRLGRPEGVALALCNMGLIYEELGQYDTALACQRRSEEIARRIGDSVGVAIALSNIGGLYLLQQAYPEALQAQLGSMQISAQLGDAEGLATARVNIARIYERTGQWNGAVQSATEGLNGAQASGSLDITRDAHEILFRLHRQRGDSKQAIGHYTAFLQLRDSINNESKHNEIARQEFSFEYARRAAADSVRNHEAAKVKDAQISAQEARLSQERTQRYLLGGGFVLIAISVFYIFSRFRITRRQKKLIESQKKKVDEAFGQLHEKNKEIMDSIHYARRIQRALITPERYIERALKKLRSASPLLLLLLLIATGAQAQGLSVAETEALLAKAGHDTVRIRIMGRFIEECLDDRVWPAYNDKVIQLCRKNLPNAKGKEYSFYLSHLSAGLSNKGYLLDNVKDYTGALAYYDSSLQLARTGNDLKSAASSLSNIGFVYKEQKKINQALEAYLEAAAMQAKVNDQRGLSITYNNLGNVYYFLGDFARGLEYLDRSVKLKEKLGEKRLAALTMQNIGVTYLNAGDPRAALRYYKMCIAPLKETNDSVSLGVLYNDIGSATNMTGDHRGALQYLLTAAKILERMDVGDKWADVLSSLGAAYEILDKDDSALYYYHKSIAVWKKFPNDYRASYAYNNLAEYHLARRQYQEAEKFARRSYEMVKGTGFPEYIYRPASILHQALESQQRFDEALRMLLLSSRMRDSVNNDENKRAAMKNQLRHEYERKAAADSVKNAEMQKVKDAGILQRESRLKQERGLRYGLYSGLALVIGFLFFALNRFRIIQKQKRIIEKQKADVDRAYEHLHEKNQEVLDSIFYARRIQRALITSERQIDRALAQVRAGT